MSLEEAIQQKIPFRNARHKATVNLIYTHNWVMNRHRDMFKEFDVTLQQYNVLRILRGSHPKPMSNSDIRDRMLDRSSDVSRIVVRLLKKDLVGRAVCEDDKRQVDVFINQTGLQLLQTIDEHASHIDSLMENLDDHEAELFNQLLDKIRG